MKCGRRARCRWGRVSVVKGWKVGSGGRGVCIGERQARWCQPPFQQVRQCRCSAYKGGRRTGARRSMSRVKSPQRGERGGGGREGEVWRGRGRYRGRYSGSSMKKEWQAKMSVVEGRVLCDG